MNLQRLFIPVLAVLLLLSLTPAIRADDPPKSTDSSIQPTDQDMPIQNGSRVLDTATASVTFLEPDSDNQTLVPATPPTNAAPPVTTKGNFDPVPLQAGHFNAETAEFEALEFEGQSLGRASDSLLPQDVEAAASTLITVENFEGNFQADPPWDRTSTTGHFWDDVDCFPAESGGSRSAWAADDFTVDNPCDDTVYSYPNNMDSWLIYGPFSLADAQSASLDFFFRLDSEVGADNFSWMASVDGNQFYGQVLSGVYTNGPFQNGHNYMSLDLTDVFTLGDLTGQPKVWIAFIFDSDNNQTNQHGAFIDLITIRKSTDLRVKLTDEDFDFLNFPNQEWESFDGDGTTNGDYRWDDVPCFSRSGTWSMWPADTGANARDVCGGQGYASFTNSWLVHGPFSLQGANEAWVEFNFRNKSEAGVDKFWWAVSVDDIDYWGFFVSGELDDGPQGNGYNLMPFDLSNVPGLGDLRGEPEVYLAFIFFSDGSINDQGPFVDDVKVIVEGNFSPAPDLESIYLPVILNPEPQPPVNLYIKNNTTKKVTFIVKNAIRNNQPIGNLSCSNLNPGGPHLCGTIDAGTYEATANTQECGSKTKEILISPDSQGNHTRTVSCSSNN